jgi:hypothetical protein
MSQKFLPSRRRTGGRGRRTTSVVKGNLELYFECARFQLGMLFGSFVLLSIVNLCIFAQTAPLFLLLAYYAICVVISFFTLCHLQIFVNQICANISSIEIIVSCKKEEEDETVY